MELCFKQMGNGYFKLDTLFYIHFFLFYYTYLYIFYILDLYYTPVIVKTLYVM